MNAPAQLGSLQSPAHTPPVLPELPDVAPLPEPEEDALVLDELVLLELLLLLELLDDDVPLLLLELADDALLLAVLEPVLALPEVVELELLVVLAAVVVVLELDDELLAVDEPQPVSMSKVAASPRVAVRKDRDRVQGGFLEVQVGTAKVPRRTAERDRDRIRPKVDCALCLGRIDGVRKKPRPRFDCWCSSTGTGR